MASTNTNEAASKRAEKRSSSIASSPEPEPAKRSKRGKYTAAACDDCKRRKLKCLPSDNNKQQCQRCLRSGISCSFAVGVGSKGTTTEGFPATIEEHPQQQPSEISPHTQILSAQLTQLQNQLNSLAGTLADLQKQIPTTSTAGGQAAQNPPLNSSSRKTRNSMDTIFNRHGTRQVTQRVEVPKEPRFIGPTRSAYSIEIGQRSLTRMGIPSYETMPSQSGPQSPAASASHQTTALDADFWQRCDVQEIRRLLDVFDEEVASVYPCLDTSDLSARAADIINWGIAEEADDAAAAAASSGSSKNELCRQDFQLAKVAIATAIVVEQYGKNEDSTMMVESAEQSVSRILRPASSLKDLQLLLILSVYYFFCDEEILAWRTIGLAAREAMVMGLHRKSTLLQTFKDPEERLLGTRVFWCIYVLDRRWSFGTSLPFALIDGDIDPELPEPGPGYEYLQCMIRYGRLCSNVWKAIISFENPFNTITEETVLTLDTMTQDWLEGIPTNLQLRHPRLGLASRAQPRVLHRLRALLYLRGNHTRMLIYRHCLLSHNRIKSDPRSAWLVVEIAQDSIHVLVHLHASSDIYRRQQNPFNYFLLSALAVIFLAVCHDPAEYAETCRKSFHAALKLVRELSRHSQASRRLWNSIKGLVPRLQTLGMRGVEEGKESDQIGAEYDTESNDKLAIDSPAGMRPGPNVGIGERQNSGQFAQEGQYHTDITMQPPMEGEPDARTDPSVTTPNIFQISNDLMTLFDVFEQGQQFPTNISGLGGYGNNNNDLYAFENMIGESGEISRRFQGLI